jgi:HK97 gp10 family phage protein
MGSKTLTPSNLRFARFELKGLDEYLARVQTAGNNVDDAVAEAVKESAKPILKDIEEWANKHKLTGATEKGVDLSDVQKEGNQTFVDVGINTEKSPGAWHAVFVEYGTPTQAADPGIRKAFSDNKSKVKKIQKEVLAREGIPVD